MEISAKADYTMRALAELAAAGGGPMKVHDLAELQQIPARFLQNILLQLRRRGLVRSQRGADGGYRLARPARDITLADAFRAVEGPLANVGGERPEDLSYTGDAESLAVVWVALRASVRNVLEHVTLDDLVHGPLPPHITEAVGDPSAWDPH